MHALTRTPPNSIKYNSTPDTRCVVRLQVHYFISKRKSTNWSVTETTKELLNIFTNWLYSMKKLVIFLLFHSPWNLKIIHCQSLGTQVLIQLVTFSLTQLKVITFAIFPLSKICFHKYSLPLLFCYFGLIFSNAFFIRALYFPISPHLNTFTIVHVFLTRNFPFLSTLTNSPWRPYLTSYDLPPTASQAVIITLHSA